MKWHEYGLAVSFVLSLKVLKSWNGKSGLFRFCAFFHSEFSLKRWKAEKGKSVIFVLVFIQRSVWSPHFFPGPDWDLKTPSPDKQTLSPPPKMQICYLTGLCFPFRGEIVSLWFICSDGKMRWRFDVTSWIMNICLNMVIKGRSVHHPAAAAKIAFHLPRRRSWTLWNMGTAGKVRSNWSIFCTFFDLMNKWKWIYADKGESVHHRPSGHFFLLLPSIFEYWALLIAF